MMNLRVDLGQLNVLSVPSIPCLKVLEDPQYRSLEKTAVR